jgi:colanic acid/amylovoran biosynthesis glycosyltransferase
VTLRVGIFVPMFPQHSETFIVTKVLKLLDAGIDVHVFTLSVSPHWDAFAVLAGRDDVRARVHVVPPLRPLARVISRGAPSLAKTALAHPRAFARYVGHTLHTRPYSFLKSLYVRSHFVGHALDILHIEFDAQAVGIADLKDYLGCHILCSSRGTLQSLGVSEDPSVLPYIFRYVDGYHFISRFLDDNTRRLGLPSDVRTWLIEPAIDLSLFDPPARAAHDRLRVISVGRLSWEKGYEHALDAIARVRAAGIPVDYTIYGSGPCEEPIRFAIGQLGLDGIAKLGGQLRREDMPRAYANADVMLHAALAEGFCNAVIEAQAMELPVVTTDRGGLPENVEDGVTGFVVASRDPAAMAEKLVALARDPALRSRMGQAGRRRAHERFDLDRQAANFVRLYHELAASPRRSA